MGGPGRLHKEKKYRKVFREHTKEAGFSGLMSFAKP